MITFHDLPALYPCPHKLHPCVLWGNESENSFEKGIFGVTKEVSVWVIGE